MSIYSINILSVGLSRASLLMDVFILVVGIISFTCRLKEFQVFETIHENGLHSLKVTCLGILKKVK